MVASDDSRTLALGSDLVEQLCIGIIGDIVASRDVAGEEREQLQARFRGLVGHLNERFEEDVLADFVITTGDEFQGLLMKGCHIPDLIWTTEAVLRPRRVRLALGRGGLDTNLTQTAIAMDGPVWHRARGALEAAKKQRRLGGVFSGFGGERDEVLGALAILLHSMRDRLTERQREVLEFLRDDQTHEEAAQELGISRQAVTKHAGAANWDAYAVGEHAWRRMLEAFDYTSAWTDD